MLRTLTITALFVTSVVMKHVSSYTENCVGELCFTIPGDSEMKNFHDAKSWCKDHNSTLSVVNDSETQTALTKLPNLLRTDLMMFINIKLSQQGNTWILVNGIHYPGAVGKQQNSEYKLYCYLNPIANSLFLVEASKPSDLRNYLCDFEGTRYQNNSTSNFLFNGRCYIKYENENLTWYQARERCISNGGDLARFQSGSNLWIPPFNTSWLDKSLTYWVGIRWNGWSWKYSDDAKEVIHTSWGIGTPNNVNYSCVCVDAEGIPPWTWSDCDCSVPRQFVCLKIVPTTTVITTTPTTTTTMTSATTRTPIPTTTSTGPTVNTDNSPAPASGNNGKLSKEQIMGLGIGIGGGVLIIVIVATIVLAVFITRRKSKGNDNSESRPAVENNGENNDEIKPTDMTASDGKDLYSQVHKPPRNQVNTSRGKDVYAQVNKHPQNQVDNDVYAKVVPDEKQQINKIESSPEIIYSAPEFVQDPKSTPSNYNYEVAYRVHEPDMVPTLRGQTQSIFPIRYSRPNAYANDEEVE